MGTSLTGVNISASYLGLLKSTDSLAISSTAKTITDGAGNDLPIKLSTSQMLFGTGSASVPALSFNGNTSEGFYIPTDENIGVTIAGSEVARLNSSGFGVIDGTSSSPSLFFTGDTNTGLYRTGSGVIGISSNGTLSGEITLTGFRAKKNSTASAPNYTFIGDDNTGLHSLDADRLDFILGGNRAFGMTYATGVSTLSTLSTDALALKVNSSERLRILNTGQIKLNTYGSGTFTGTVTQRLGVDSSGNVIEIPIGAGAVDGSGTANTVTMWSDTDTITDAPITISGNDSTFAGVVKADGGNVALGNISGVARLQHEGSGQLKMLSSGDSTIGTFTSTGTTFPSDVSVEDNLYLTDAGTTRGKIQLNASDRDDVDIKAVSLGSNMKFFTENTEHMRLDSGGRLLVNGTTNVDATPLQVTAPSGFTVVSGFISPEATSSIQFKASGTTANYKVRVGAVADDLLLFSGGNETARLDSSGRLGLGTSSPANNLQVKTDTNGGGITIQRNSSTSGAFADLMFSITTVDSGSPPTKIRAIRGSSYQETDIAFETNTSERMRLDSSGNLLVGKTSNTLATAGAKLGTGGSNFTRDSAEVVFVNRTTNDGSAITIAKDGTSVGVIGTQNWGIGTTSPSRNLSIVSDSFYSLELQGSNAYNNLVDTGIVFSAKYNSSGQTTDVASIRGGRKSTADGNYAGVLKFFTRPNGGSDTERMRIDATGKVGIATSSPSQSLEVAGNIYASSVGSSLLFDTTSGAGSNGIKTINDFETLIFNGRGSAGFAVIGNSNIRLGFGTNYTNAETDLFIDNGGNVGINEDNPLQKLHVNSGGGNSPAIFESTDLVSQIWLKDSSSSTTYQTGIACSGDNLIFNNGAERMRIDSSGVMYIMGATPSTNNSLQMQYNSTAGSAEISAKSTGGNTHFEFYTSSSGTTTEKMRITSAGNVGIGETSPSGKLDVRPNDGCNYVFDGTSTSGYTTTFNMDDIGLDIGHNSSSRSLNLQTNSLDRITISGGGNVGISTDSPATKLDVNSNISASSANVISISQNTTGAIKQAVAFGVAIQNGGESTNASDLFISTASGGSLSERMRISSGGDVLVGTTGAISTGNGFSITNTGQVRIGRASTGTIKQIVFSNPNDEVGSISTSGSATAYNTSSDYRLKEDLQDFNALEIASKIKMYDFKWKADDSRSYGVMAHELKEVLPQAVSGEKDGEEMQGVDYSKLVPILLKSIQELKAEIDELKKNK